MKCKKIFAMLLALCMVLSTFAVVSAEDGSLDFTLKRTVGNPGVLNGNDYTLTYAEMVKKANGNPDSVGWTPFLSMNFDEAIDKDGKDFKVTFDFEIDGLISSVNKEYESMELRLRLYQNKDSQNPTLGVISKTVQLSDGAAYVEISSADKIAPSAGSTNHTKLLSDLAADIACIGIVPAVSGVVKADNSADDAYMKLSNIAIEYVEKIEPEYEKVVNVKKTMDDEDTGLLYASEVTSLTYSEDGIATAILSGTGNNSMVGVMVADSDGKAYKVKAGDTIKYSIKLNPSVAFSTTTGTQGIMLRNGTAYPPDGTPFAGIHPGVAVPANQWTTLEGSYVVAENFSGNAYINIRPQVKMTLLVDEITISIEKEVIPDITNIKLKEAKADSAVFTVKTDGYITSTSIKNYCKINGQKWPSGKISVKTISKNEIEVTVKGLGAGVPYDFELTGAESVTGGKVSIECDDTVEFTTMYEVNVDAEVGETVTYTITNNTLDDVEAYAVLLRCKDNSVIKTEGCVPVELTDEESGEFEVDPLADGEYFRFFVWSFDGAIRSLTGLKDLK